MTKEEKEAYRGAGRVAFLARKQEIKEMIDAGHPIKNVYRKYGDKLNISYGQFARYVNKFIRSKPAEIPAKNESKVKEKEMSILDAFKTPIDKKDIF